VLSRKSDPNKRNNYYIDTRGPAGPLEKALNGVTAYMRCPEMGTSSSCPECGSKMTRLRDTKGASKNASGRSVCCTNPDCGLREFKTLEDGTVVTDSKGKPVKWDHPLANRDHLAVLGIAFLFQCIVLQVEAPEAYRPRARDEILIDSNGVVKVKVNKEARKRAREANEANKKARPRNHTYDTKIHQDTLCMILYYVCIMGRTRVSLIKNNTKKYTPFFLIFQFSLPFCPSDVSSSRAVLGPTQRHEKTRKKWVKNLKKKNSIFSRLFFLIFS
jgi:hypothetical protein